MKSYINNCMKTFIQFLESNSAAMSNVHLCVQADTEATNAPSIKDLVVVGDQIAIPPDSVDRHD